MFSKIILAALCSSAVSGSPGAADNTNKPAGFVPVKVIPGCINLFAGK